MCGWPPARKENFAYWNRRSLAVMCPACWRGGRPQALMGSVDRGLIRLAGSRCPMSSDRSPSIRRSTDDAITRLHPRKSLCAQVLFLCSISEPFLRPDLVPQWRRAQPQSRLAEGHRRRRARSGLDGGEHGARLVQVGGTTDRAAGCGSPPGASSPPRRCVPSCWRAHRRRPCAPWFRAISPARDPLWRACCTTPTLRH